MPSVRHVYGFVIYVMKTFNGLNFMKNTVCMHYDYLLIISFTLNQLLCCFIYRESIMSKSSNLMYHCNQYTLLNNLTLNIWLCVHMHQTDF